MAEEKAKKKTNTKANRNSQNKKNNYRKGQNYNRKKTSNTNRKPKTSNQSKTATTKETTPSVIKEIKEKVTPIEEPKLEVKEEPKVEKEEKVEKNTSSAKEEQLEKTIIFDGTQNKNLNDVVDRLEEDNVVLDDKVIKRSKTKKAIIVILAITILGFIIATTYYVVSHEINNHPTSTLNVNLYKRVSKMIKKEGKLTPRTEPAELAEDYEHLETISLADLEQKIINKEDMVVLIASTNCYSCATFEPVIEEVLAARNETIYRVNVATLTKEEGERFLDYYDFGRTPTLFRTKDGYVSQEIHGTTTKEDLEKWLELK